jgi:hypothetical protein
MKSPPPHPNLWLWKIAVVASFALLVSACQVAGPEEKGVPFEDRLQAAFGELERSGVTALVAMSHHGGPVVIREFGAARSDGVPWRPHSSGRQLDH